MKKYVKALAFLLAASMLVCGCGQKEETAGETTEAAQETEVETGEEAPIDVPEVDMSKGLDSEGFVDAAMMVDGVVLADYRSAAFDKDQVYAAEADVQKAIDGVLERYGEDKEVKDRAIVDGDLVNIDFVGSIDGVEFEGGNSQGEGYDLEIGSHNFIDTFEEQLIGHKPGEEVVVKATFPETYGKEDLAGKQAEFKTTINYIVETVLPELTDEFVAENFKEEYGLETAEALTKDVRDAMDEEVRQETLWKYMIDNTTFEKEPELLTETLLDNYMDTIRANVAMYGMKIDDYLQYMGMESEDDLRESQRGEAGELARRYIIAQLVSEQENITIDDAALAEFFGESDFAGLLEQYGEGYVKMSVRMSKVLDKIFESIHVNE